eukprot:56472-Chlamydomonas_euryale.AAC.1
MQARWCFWQRRGVTVGDVLGMAEVRGGSCQGGAHSSVVARCSHTCFLGVGHGICQYLSVSGSVSVRGIKVCECPRDQGSRSVSVRGIKVCERLRDQ